MPDAECGSWRVVCGVGARGPAAGVRSCCSARDAELPTLLALRHNDKVSRAANSRCCCRGDTQLGAGRGQVWRRCAEEGHVCARRRSSTQPQALRSDCVRAAAAEGARGSLVPAVGTRSVGGVARGCARMVVVAAEATGRPAQQQQPRAERRRGRGAAAAGSAGAGCCACSPRPRLALGNGGVGGAASAPLARSACTQGAAAPLPGWRQCLPSAGRTHHSSIA
jgi:hypothetical protein